jgi:hypothetical protein
MRLKTELAERRLLRIRGRARANSEKPMSANVQAYLRGEALTAESSDPAKPADERRRYTRISRASEIVVRRIGGFNFQVALRDLSSGGCRVEMVQACDSGDSLIARLPGLEPLGSRVRWGEGRVTGVEFLRPIHPAVLDALVPRLPQLEPQPEEETTQVS